MNPIVKNLWYDILMPNFYRTADSTDESFELYYVVSTGKDFYDYTSNINEFGRILRRMKIKYSEELIDADQTIFNFNIEDKTIKFTLNYNEKLGCLMSTNQITLRSF